MQKITTFDSLSNWLLARKICNVRFLEHTTRSTFQTNCVSSPYSFCRNFCLVVLAGVSLKKHYIFGISCYFCTHTSTVEYIFKILRTMLEANTIFFHFLILVLPSVSLLCKQFLIDSPHERPDFFSPADFAKKSAVKFFFEQYLFLERELFHTTNKITMS